MRGARGEGCLEKERIFGYVEGCAQGFVKGKADEGEHAGSGPTVRGVGEGMEVTEGARCMCQ